MITTRMPRDFNAFLRSFLAHDVRYLLIGGYAVNAFGYVRNTIDIDVWIASDPDNRKRAISAIREFAFPSAPDDLFDDPNKFVRMGVAPVRIEVLQIISGVEFDDCWNRRVELAEEDILIPMISLPDLKANKRASGRPKDLVDLSNLP